MTLRKYASCAAILLSTGLLITSAVAIGPGEFALTGRDAGGSRIGEEHILTQPGSSDYYARNYCGRTFYVSNYSERKMLDWVSKGYGVNVEYVTLDGKRNVLCAIH